MDITKFVNWENKTCIGGGGFGDVYICKMSSENIAVKVIRVQRNGEEDLKQLFRRMERERRVWKGLENENVLELLGVCYKPELTHDLKVMCFVSHYMKGGESTKYLKGHPETDFHRFMTGIAEGLSYLHSEKVVHGDLKATNVLVDINDEGDAVPRISDFGMSQLIQETDITVTRDWNQGGRYSPPEYVDYGVGPSLAYAGPKNPTPQGDVWMYSMTVLELYTGKQPYWGMRHHQATIALSRREMPNIGKAQHRSFEAFALTIVRLCATDMCWNFNPNRRPTMSMIAEYLKGTLSYMDLFSCLSIDVDDDVESDKEPESPTQPIFPHLKRIQTSGKGDFSLPDHSGVFSQDFASTTDRLQKIELDFETVPVEYAFGFKPRDVLPLPSLPRHRRVARLLRQRRD